LRPFGFAELFAGSPVAQPLQIPFSVILNFNHVYYFHVVATEGSIVRAAEKLGVTQPTVSEQIRNLERALGTPLFERSSMGLKMTDAGRLAFGQTTVMFQASERLLEGLSQSEQPTPRTLRVGISSAASRSVAADFLMPMLQVPDCLPNIRSGDTLDLMRQLRSHELDLVLSENPPPTIVGDGFKVVDLYRPRLVAISAIPREGASLVKDPWQELPLINYRPGSPFRWEVEHHLRERGMTPKLIGETDDALFMLEAVIRGVCIAFVPRSVARDAILQKRVRVLTVLPPNGISLNAVYHDGGSVAQTTHAVELLVAYSRDQLDPET